VPPALSRWLPRALVSAVVAAAAVLAWREGGGADARVPPPRPEAAPVAKEAGGDRGRGAEAYEVTARLVEKLGEARLDVPSLGAAQQYLQPYWRKMRVPWVHLPGLSAQVATTLAMRTSHDVEAQLSVPVPGGTTWVPEARLWNMNEGSFDQREALFAPTPATVSFRLDLPPQARLRVSPAILMPLSSTTVFDVTLVDAAGTEHAISQTRIQGGDARRWIDVDADLAAWGGQKVELRLRTSLDKPAAFEKKWMPPAIDTAAAETPRRGDHAAPPRAGAPRAGDRGVDRRVERRGTPDASPSEAYVVPSMSLAFWGDPVVVAREPTRVPYDVLWIVVDALRPDVAASLHDPAEDAAELAAPRPPLEAKLPAVPGLMPSLDRLAERGVRFLHAWSAGAWTRPGTLAMLTGERSGELGIDTREWILPVEQVSRYYAAEPPLLPLVLRHSGVETAAFVNNFFMAGYAGVGLDMGFERVTDHRYRARDTAEITRDALAWLEAHAGSRFFLFVNYNSPHEPYDAPHEFVARIPPPPLGPRDAQVRGYMAEGAKDDAALGTLLDKLDALGIAKSTLVVVTSDHGETLSVAHAGYAMEHLPVRFHHAVGNFEETTRVPIVMALPGAADGGRAVTERVRNTDIAPTVLELEGLEADPRMSGRSLVPLVRGQKEGEPRVVVTEGRASRAILWDRWHLIVHDAPDPEDQLFDLREDPGERRDVARTHADVVAEMKARLAAALAGVRAADAPQEPAGALPIVHVRFAGGGRVHRVSGVVNVGDGKHGASAFVEAVGAPHEAIRVDGPKVDFALQTAASAAVGFDLRVDPPGAPVTWSFYLDDAPWPDGATFTGPFGLPAVAARAGIASDEARTEAYAPALPVIDPARDLGVFITRDRSGDAAGAAPATAGEGAVEMQRMLQQWGYAHGSH
jgi:arylsulfatase A-like enzyme